MSGFLLLHRFILNLRPVEDWVQSVLNWQNGLATELANEYHVQSKGDMALPQNDSEMRDFLRNIYLDHNEMIREFVKRYPSHALVEIDISDPMAGEVLAESFGLDGSCWTHENKNLVLEQA